MNWSLTKCNENHYKLKLTYYTLCLFDSSSTQDIKSSHRYIYLSDSKCYFSDSAYVHALNNSQNNEVQFVLKTYMY